MLNRAYTAAQADLNDRLQQGSGIMTDPTVADLSRRIDHIRAEIGGFEDGTCPTCGQEV